jgi:hypothetical protein
LGATAEEDREAKTARRNARVTVGTVLRSGNFRGMSDDAKRFRDRAKDCRALSKNARNAEDRQMLEEIADELDAEARRIEAEEDR